MPSPENISPGIWGALFGALAIVIDRLIAKYRPRKQHELDERRLLAEERAELRDEMNTRYQECKDAMETLHNDNLRLEREIEEIKNENLKLRIQLATVQLELRAYERGNEAK